MADRNDEPVHAPALAKARPRNEEAPSPSIQDHGRFLETNANGAEIWTWCDDYYMIDNDPKFPTPYVAKIGIGNLGDSLFVSSQPEDSYSAVNFSHSQLYEKRCAIQSYHIDPANLARKGPIEPPRLATAKTFKEWDNHDWLTTLNARGRQVFPVAFSSCNLQWQRAVSNWQTYNPARVHSTRVQRSLSHIARNFVQRHRHHTLNQPYPTNAAGHSPIKEVADAYNPKHRRDTESDLDVLDSAIATAKSNRTRMYVICDFESTGDSYTEGTTLPNGAMIVTHPIDKCLGYWRLDLCDSSVAPYALWAIAVRGGQSIPYVWTAWSGYDPRRMWFPLQPHDFSSTVPCVIHRTDAAAMHLIMRPGGLLKPGGTQGARLSAMAAGKPHEFLKPSTHIKGCRPLQKAVICLCKDYMAARPNRAHSIYHDEEGVIHFTTPIENAAVLQIWQIFDSDPPLPDARFAHGLRQSTPKRCR